MIAKQQPIRAVALDLDGTLLGNDHKLSATNAEALHKAYRAGIHVIISSGRMTPTILPFCKQIGLPCTIVSYNGARLSHFEPTNKVSIVFDYGLPAEIASEIYQLCSQWKVLLNIYVNDELWAFQQDGDYTLADFYQHQTSSVYVQKISDLKLLPTQHVTKLLAIVDKNVRDTIYQNFFVEIGQKCQVIKSQPEYIEFTRQGVTKALALGEFFAKQGWDPKTCMAMGDAENDLEMLTWAGHGIAVANASEGLKKHFSNHSAYTNEEFAVAKEIESRILAHTHG